MAFSFLPTNTKKGFTLIELLIVVTIMAILMAFIAFVTSVMIQRARVARAQGDMNAIAKAVKQLEVDTGMHPGVRALSPCTSSGVSYGLTSTTQTTIGILAGPGSFTNWKGPYAEEIPMDPWGTQYYFRYDYLCRPTTKGCEQYTSNTRVRAIFSSGPNRSAATSDVAADVADDVVLPLCS